MCINNDFVERHAYQMYEEIKKSSLFKVVRVEGIGGTYLNPEKLKEQMNSQELITNIVLEDNNKKRYVVNPDPFGYKFANGEISYKEYKNMQKMDDFKWISYSILGMGFLSIMLYFLIRFIN